MLGFNKNKLLSVHGYLEPVTILAGVGLAVSVISTAMQHEAAGDAADAAGNQAQAQKESQAAQGRMAEVEAQRARIAQVREARIRRSQVLASTGAIGQGSSGVQGAIGSIGTQTSSNIGVINQTQSFAQQATAANQRAADAGGEIAQAQAKGQQWQTINSIFGATRQDFATIFKKTT